MNTVKAYGQTSYPDVVIKELEQNMPLLACQVTLELNDLIENSAKEIAAIRILSTIISQRIVNVKKNGSSSNLIDPGKAILMRQVIEKSYSNNRTLESLEELRNETKSILERMNEVISKVEEEKDVDKDDLVRLKVMSEVLWAVASASEPARYEKLSKSHF